MFANAYQNSPVLQVFDAKVNVDKNAFYKQLFKINSTKNYKQFDKEVKSYLYNIQGQNTKMIIPADQKNLLSLHQRYLILHLYVPIGFVWTLEFTMTDLSGTKRRINITTNQGKQEVKYFSFRYPLQNLKKGVWLFLGIDVFSFMNVFTSQTFRSLDQITIGSSCRLRRVFTMKQFVQWEIPKSYWLSNQITQQFQLIQYDPNQIKLQMQLSKQLSQPRSPKSVQKTIDKLKSKSKNVNQNMIQKKQKSVDKIQIKKENMMYDLQQSSPKKLGKSIKKSDIIQNARTKLQYLQKQQERIINASKINQSISVPTKNLNKKVSNTNLPKQIKTNQITQSVIGRKLSKQYGMNQKKSQSKIQSKQQIAPVVDKSSKDNKKVNKAPIVQKQFKQDIENQIDENESSNFTEEHMRNKFERTINPGTPYGFESKQQIIQQDHWSSQEKINRPISQSISNMTGNFPSTIITKQNNKEIVISKKVQNEMQLIYDEMVGCYYHPETNSYYQINH